MWAWELWELMLSKELDFPIWASLLQFLWVIGKLPLPILIIISMHPSHLFMIFVFNRKLSKNSAFLCCKTSRPLRAGPLCSPPLVVWGGVEEEEEEIEREREREICWKINQPYYLQVHICELLVTWSLATNKVNICIPLLPSSFISYVRPVIPALQFGSATPAFSAQLWSIYKMNVLSIV